MSVRTMTRVWEMDLPDSDKIVLLALADCANDEGHCWPSVASLVRKCSKSERTIQASIKRLVDDGLLLRREVLGKGCNYTVLPKSPAKPTPRDGCAPEVTAPPQGTTPTPAAAADKPSVTINTGDKSPVDQVFDGWDEMAARTGLPKVRVRDASRKQSARLRIKSVGLPAMLEAIEIIGRSDWLKGSGRSNNWRPTIDFIFQPESLRKLLEGAYGGEVKHRAPPRPFSATELPNAIAFFRAQGDLKRVAELEEQLAVARAQ